MQTLIASKDADVERLQRDLSDTYTQNAALTSGNSALAARVTELEMVMKKKVGTADAATLEAIRTAETTAQDAASVFAEERRRLHDEVSKARNDGLALQSEVVKAQGLLAAKDAELALGKEAAEGLKHKHSGEMVELKRKLVEMAEIASVLKVRPLPFGPPGFASRGCRVHNIQAYQPPAAVRPQGVALPAPVGSLSRPLPRPHLSSPYLDPILTST